MLRFSNPGVLYMVEDVSDDDYALDRKFLSLSSTMADCYRWTYGLLCYRLVAPLDPNKFDNATSRVKELGIRTLIVLGAMVSVVAGGTFIALTAVVLGVGSKVFRAAGFYFQKDGFTHIRGAAPEVVLKDGEASFMTWNIRGYGAGLHYDHGGVVSWKSRIDGIVDTIQKANPDVIVLQDVLNSGLVESLVAKLGNQYAHFYTYFGGKTWNSESGTMIITKCSVERFSNTDFRTNESDINRGFEIFEIKASSEDKSPCIRVVGTQLTSGKEAKEKRMDQIEQIVTKVGRLKGDLPTFLAASGNLDQRGEEGEFLNKFFYPTRDKEPTHSPDLIKQWAPIYEGEEESSDFISFLRRNTAEGKVLPVIERNVRLLETRIIPAFEINPKTQLPDTTTARSDHHAVYTRIKFK